MRFFCEVGEACEDWHDSNFTGLEIDRLQLDEQWAYCHTHKEKLSVKEQLHGSPEKGDCWLWCALDPNSKSVVAWNTGKRTGDQANELVSAVARRVNRNVTVTSDPLATYKKPVAQHLGEDADYATEYKKFGKPESGPHFLIKPINRLLGVERKKVSGNPDMSKATIAHVERYFLTVRQGNKRCARKTLAYSKKWENHRLFMSIHLFVYNMVRKHETIKDAPAVKLGVIDKRWSLEDVVRMTDRYLKKKTDAQFEAAFAELEKP